MFAELPVRRPTTDREQHIPRQAHPLSQEPQEFRWELCDNP